jgi:hypothetical protein
VLLKAETTQRKLLDAILLNEAVLSHIYISNLPHFIAALPILVPELFVAQSLLIHDLVRNRVIQHTIPRPQMNKFECDLLLDSWRQFSCVVLAVFLSVRLAFAPEASFFLLVVKLPTHDIVVISLPVGFCGFELRDLAVCLGFGLVLCLVLVVYYVVITFNFDLFVFNFINLNKSLNCARSNLHW